jgi:hypothetical protein
MTEVLESQSISQHGLQSALVEHGKDLEVLQAMNQMNKVTASIVNTTEIPESLTFDKLEEVLEYQIQRLQERKSLARAKLDILEFQTEVADLVHERYGLESDQVTAAVNKYSGEHPQLSDYLQRMSQASSELFGAS